MERNLNSILEIDRMKGTKFPPGELSEAPVSIDGKVYNLKTIYSKSGIDLQIKLSSDEISPLDSGVYPREELHNLMSRYSSRNEYSINNTTGRENDAEPKKMLAYLIIVDGITIDSQTGEPTESILGMMFDFDKREGTAVFYGSQFIKNDPIAYLRTSAHEIGHQFNLHHEDATSYKKNGLRKCSIMCQTRHIKDVAKNESGNSENWRKFALFEFGDLEKQHLQTHPFDKVAPGGSPFLTEGLQDYPLCTVDHNSWHPKYFPRLGLSSNDISITDDSINTMNPDETLGLEFTIKMGKDKYLPGQPAIAYLEIKNNSLDPIRLIKNLSPEYEVVQFFIKYEEKTNKFVPYTILDYIPTETILKPNESLYGHAKIFYGSGGYSFPQPGLYKVKATYSGLIDRPGKIIASNTVEVNVIAPKDQDEEEQVSLIKGKEQALFLLFEGGDHLEEGINKLDQLAKKYPTSNLGTYANAVLGLRWSKDFKDYKKGKIRKKDFNQARSFLETAENNVKGHWADATFLKLADIHRESGEKGQTKKVLEKFLNKFEEDSKNANGVSIAKKILNEEI
jgi:hypothetical protein